MVIAVGLALSVIHGRGHAERAIRWIAGKFHVNGDKATDVLRQVGTRLEELFDDKQLLKRTVIWAAAHWLTGAASLWVFLRAFGTSLDLDALIDGALKQQRLLVVSPREAGPEELGTILRASL